MTYIAKPRLHHPKLPTNALGYTHRDYEGSVSTLCAGCGHDSISAAIIQACFELSLPPHRIAKLSGIGCSSKTPTYFLGQSHGFNSVHGRMPSVLTGANLANRDLIYLGVSGDGDSASIGLGQFAHCIRRGVDMVYIVENNGVYGLTKGQFSATADKGSKAKRGAVNSDSPIDLVAMALQLGASFVARSFSGDKAQLVPLIKAAIQHKGAAFIDVISPCVAFNNHPGSTKSFDYVRAHNEAVNQLDCMVEREAITADYAPGTVETVIAARRLGAAAAQARARLRSARPDLGADLSAAAPCGRRGRHRPAVRRARSRRPARLSSIRSRRRSTRSARPSFAPAPTRSTATTPRTAEPGEERHEDRLGPACTGECRRTVERPVRMQCSAMNDISQASEAVRAKPAIVRPRDAASLILLRGKGRDLELLAGRRPRQSSSCRVSGYFPAARSIPKTRSRGGSRPAARICRRVSRAAPAPHCARPGRRSAYWLAGAPDRRRPRPRTCTASARSRRPMPGMVSARQSMS